MNEYPFSDTRTFYGSVLVLMIDHNHHVRRFYQFFEHRTGPGPDPVLHPFRVGPSNQELVHLPDDVTDDAAGLWRFRSADRRKTLCVKPQRSEVTASLRGAGLGQGHCSRADGV